MRIKKRVCSLLLFCFLLLVFFPGIVWGSDYFMYDFDRNMVLYMNNQDTTFVPKTTLTKCPNFIMETNNPDRYLAVYAPDANQQIPGQKKQEPVAGQLVLFNAATGTIEDLVDLGFYPFRWTHSNDRCHFYISYRSVSGSDSCELLHYDLTTQTTEKLENLPGNAQDLELLSDEGKIYFMTTAKKIGSQLYTINTTPLEIVNSIQVGEDARQIFVLGKDRLALLNYDLERRREGAIRFFNPSDSTVVEETKLRKGRTYWHWYAKQRVLIVVNGEQSTDVIFGQRGYVYKVTAEGVKTNKTRNPWLDYEYYPDKDCLYIIECYSMEVFDYKNDTSINVNTGQNFYTASPYNYFYLFYRLPDSNLVTLYCPHNGEYKFFDLDTNKILKTVSGGRPGKRFLNMLIDRDAKAVITTDNEKSQFYLFNLGTKDITVYDRDFKQLTYIVPDEDPLTMFQIKNPDLQTLVVTVKALYRIDYNSSTLIPIYQFPVTPKSAGLLQDQNRILFWTDQELLILEPGSLKILNRVDYYQEPEGGFSRLKKGDRRYYFIQPL